MDIEFNVLLNSVSFYIAPRTTKYVNLVCACHLGEEVPGPFPAPPPKSGKSALGTRLAIFLLFTHGTKCLHINSIPKIVIQFCYLTDLRLYRHWNCFLSSVATDGKDRRGLKLKTPGPTSSFNAISGCKIPPRKLLWFKWFLMKLCYIFFTTLQEHFVYWYTLSNDFSIELIPKVAISWWPDSPFKTCDHLLKISFVVDRWTFLYWRERICKIKQING